MNNICVNGKFVKDDEPVLFAADRSYRYGDGLFETMKVWKGDILLAEYHFERLFQGMALLQFRVPPHFTKEILAEKIKQLSRKNGCEQLARVRLSLSRGKGGLYDADADLHYLVECWPLNETANLFNTNGLVTGAYTGMKKLRDNFSNLKSANFLPYVMAALHAKQNKWNDAILLNSDGNIADSTIANVFIIKDGIISTPASDQGCVKGVMRRHLLAELPKHGFTVQEKTISISDIESADEVFLTNAINGIRWVRNFENKEYSPQVIPQIYSILFKTIFG